MTAEVVNFDEAKRFELDRQAFRLKLTGFPHWQIARQLKCTVDEVKASLIRMCAGVTPELKARTVEINLERCEDLMQIYYTRARGGDPEATVLCIRLMDRQSKFLGLDVLPGGTTHDYKREPSNYDKIREAVLRVARGPVIEGEAVETPKSDA